MGCTERKKSGDLKTMSEFLLNSSRFGNVFLSHLRGEEKFFIFKKKNSMKIRKEYQEKLNPPRKLIKMSSKKIKTLLRILNDSEKFKNKLSFKVKTIFNT